MGPLKRIAKGIFTFFLPLQIFQKTFSSVKCFLNKSFIHPRLKRQYTWLGCIVVTYFYSLSYGNVRCKRCKIRCRLHLMHMIYIKDRYDIIILSHDLKNVIVETMRYILLITNFFNKDFYQYVIHTLLLHWNMVRLIELIAYICNARIGLLMSSIFCKPSNEPWRTISDNSLLILDLHLLSSTLQYGI